MSEQKPQKMCAMTFVATMERQPGKVLMHCDCAPLGDVGLADALFMSGHVEVDAAREAARILRLIGERHPDKLEKFRESYDRVKREAALANPADVAKASAPPPEPPVLGGAESPFTEPEKKEG
jgi:hypothetical protein